MKDFLKKIQTGDEGTKRLWLILFSGIAMILVVFFWIKYFNSIAQPVEQPQQQESAQEAGQSFSFWQTLKAGIGVIFQSIADTFHYTFNKILEPKSYIIKP